MLLKKCFELHEELRKRLGDDLVISLAYDDGKYILAVSTHKALDKEFSHGKPIQSCFFNEVDLETNVQKIAAILEGMYKNVLVPATDEHFKDVEKVVKEAGHVIG